MSREIRVYLIHVGVYWKYSGDSDSNGEPVYHPPIEIRCRVEDHTHETFDREGRTLETNPRIYTDFLMSEKDAFWSDKTLYRKYTPGSMLAKLKSLTDPYQNDANEVRKKYNMPNARGYETLYVSFT